MWPTLERRAGDTAAAAVRAPVGGGSAAAAAPAAAGAAAPAKKNWDKVLAEETEDKPEGEAALMSLFQQIFKNGDEDTRRAMVKSFQTSGGTVLSTNWREVKEEKYEDKIQAPEGMEVKRWADAAGGAAPAKAPSRADGAE
jgi:suppressor of G2 allele of SKP1